jgi:hypothetical protein
MYLQAPLDTMTVKFLPLRNLQFYKDKQVNIIDYHHLEKLLGEPWSDTVIKPRVGTREGFRTCLPSINSGGKSPSLS